MSNRHESLDKDRNDIEECTDAQGLRLRRLTTRDINSSERVVRCRPAISFFLTQSLAARRLVIVAAFLCALDALAFGGGGLRSLTEAATNAGRSEDFVQGIAELNKAPVKARAAFGAFVLFVIALAGTVSKRQSP